MGLGGKKNPINRQGGKSRGRDGKSFLKIFTGVEANENVGRRPGIHVGGEKRGGERIITRSQCRPSKASGHYGYQKKKRYDQETDHLRKESSHLLTKGKGHY